MLTTPNLSLQLLEESMSLAESDGVLNAGFTQIDAVYQALVNSLQSPDAATLGGASLAEVRDLSQTLGVLPLEKGGTGVTDMPALVAALGLDVLIAAGAQTAIDDWVGAAPGQLDTVNEIAAALGNDPDFASTITALIATKANLDHSHDRDDLPALPTLISDTDTLGNADIMWGNALPVPADLESETYWERLGSGHSFWSGASTEAAAFKRYNLEDDDPTGSGLRLATEYCPRVTRDTVVKAMFRCQSTGTPDSSIALRLNWLDDNDAVLSTTEFVEAGNTENTIRWVTVEGSAPTNVRKVQLEIVRSTDETNAGNWLLADPRMWVTNGAGSGFDPTSDLTALVTNQAVASDLSVDGIPAGTSLIVITLDDIRHSGGSTYSRFGLRIGDSGGLEISGYRGVAQGSGAEERTDMYPIAYHGSAGVTKYGFIILQRLGGNTWEFTSVFEEREFIGQGIKTLSGELTQLSLHRANGNDLDGGTMTVEYK